MNKKTAEEQIKEIDIYMRLYREARKEIAQAKIMILLTDLFLLGIIMGVILIWNAQNAKKEDWKCIKTIQENTDTNATNADTTQEKKNTHQTRKRNKNKNEKNNRIMWI